MSKPNTLIKVLCPSTAKVEYEPYLVKNWITNILITHLKEQKLNLNNDDFIILCKKKINGLSFFEITEGKLEH